MMMDATQFKVRLDEIKTTYQNKPHNSAFKHVIELELQALLQSYLWENEGFSRALNKRKHNVLLLKWHPDKSSSLDVDSFDYWYANTIKDDGIAGLNQIALIQALNVVTEQYRPELVYRLEDAIADANQGRANASPRHFYFFSYIAENSPLIYNLFWPIFYLFESLERNIENYADVSYRNIAKKIYGLASLAPGIILTGIAKMDSDVWREISYSAPTMKWLMDIILNAELSIALVGISAVLVGMVNYYLLHDDWGQRLDNSNDLFKTIFFEIPLVTFRHCYEKFQRATVPQEFSAKCIHYGKHLGAIALSGLMGGAAIGANLFGLYYASPLMLGLLAFPLAGLVIANTPLIIQQTVQSPKQAMDFMSTYVFTIANRYISIAKQALTNAFELLEKTGLYNKSKPVESAQGRNIPQHNTHGSTHTMSASQQSSTLQATTNASLPYWKTKLHTLVNLSEDDLSAKKRKWRRKRNQLLTELGFAGEENVFTNKLNEYANINSTLKDANGFEQKHQHENNPVALETLNYKAQTFYLRDALKNKSPKSLIERNAQQDLKYDCLEKTGQKAALHYKK